METRSQVKKDIGWGLGREVLSTGASVLLEWGCVTLPGLGCVHPHGGSPKPSCWDLMVASSCGHDRLWTHFQSFSPVWRTGGGAEHFKLLIKTGLSGEQKPVQSCLWRTWCFYKSLKTVSLPSSIVLLISYSCCGIPSSLWIYAFSLLSFL